MQTLLQAKADPLYNQDYRRNRNNSFNLVHLSLHFSVMSDFTKKGQFRWVEQTTGMHWFSPSNPPSLSVASICALVYSYS